jgi:hypothetical protein
MREFNTAFFLLAIIICILPENPNLRKKHPFPKLCQTAPDSALKLWTGTFFLYG